MFPGAHKHSCRPAGLSPRCGHGASVSDRAPSNYPQPSNTMSEFQSVTVTIRPNDESVDNSSITPNGNPVSLQLNRGFTTTIPNYRIVMCTRTAAGGLAIERDIGQGAYPSLQDPNGPPPTFSLGTPTQLQNRIAVIVADGVALPPNTAGQIDIVTDILQPTAANPARRVIWSAISVQAIQVNGGRFEIAFA